MSTLGSGHVQHVSSTDAEWAITEALKNGKTPNDAVAATIASWYQTPGGPGKAFATLASGALVDRDDLFAAVQNELRGHHQGTDRHMWALGMWVASK
jgi:hypothetical protein